jgi:hypothetical protein
MITASDRRHLILTPLNKIKVDRANSTCLAAILDAPGDAASLACNRPPD